MSVADSDNWKPPSEAIQRLFRFGDAQEQQQLQSDPKMNASQLGDDAAALAKPTADESSFTEEEFAKMPSTLMKAIRRTDALVLQTELARKAAIETNNELKAIQTLMVRYAKKHLKESEKTSPEPDGNKEKGFHRPCRISDAMCLFIGKDKGCLSSRVEVNQFINNYIKQNGLSDAENAQCIIPDERLWSILSESARGNKITYFSIQKYIKHHFLKTVK